MNGNREDLLFSRVVDGEAGAAEWTELEVIAQDDPAVWERLATAVRAESRVRSALDEALAPAEAVSLRPDDRPQDARSPRSRPSRRLSAISGWAAAGLLALLWGWGAPEAGAPGPGSVPAPAEARLVEAPASPFEGTWGKPEYIASEALDEYMQEGRKDGRVVWELPHELMETRLLANGKSLEVVYLRRWLERATIDHVFEVREDEQGLPRSVPVSPTRFVSTGPH